MPTLVGSWWAIVLRGVIAVLFALAAFAWPGLTLVSLAILFGAYALVDGVLALVAAFRVSQHHQRWWPLVIEGLVGIVAGILAFVWPTLTVLAFIYLLAGWAIVTGVLEIAAAIRLRQEISNEWMLALAGVASLVFGVILAVFPLSGILAVAWIIGAYALVFGILLIVLGLRLRQPATA